MSSRWLLAIVAALIAVFVVVAMKNSPSLGNVNELSAAQSSPTLSINGHSIKIDVVDSDAQRTKGLGGREGLQMGEGMFFIFDHNDRFGIWMKDMRFAIDIVWIAQDGRVVDVRENVSPDTYPEVFLPKSPARYVLELAAGSVKAFKINEGDIVRH